MEVAFNPEVLHKSEKNPKEKEQIYLLALNFIQKHHKLSLSQHFTVMNDRLKGTVQEIKHRLTSLHQSKSRTLNQDNVQIKPGKIWQICKWCSLFQLTRKISWKIICTCFQIWFFNSICISISPYFVINNFCRDFKAYDLFSSANFFPQPSHCFSRSALCEQVKLERNPAYSWIRDRRSKTKPGQVWLRWSPAPSLFSLSSRSIRWQCAHWAVTQSGR